MKKQLEVIVVVLTVTLFIGITVFLPAHLNAGSLEPTGPPGPTMRTLDEIYQAITPLPTGFVLWEDNPRFAVWDGKTPDKTDDDVVLDRATELMWARDQTGGAGFPVRGTWQSGIDWCNSQFIGGYRFDWRVPSLGELLSLMELEPSEHSPALPSGHPFINIQKDWYWSSTSTSAEDAWGVHAGYGGLAGSIDKDDYCYLWCVRGGHGHDGY